MIEVEGVEQIRQRRAVGRHVRIALLHDRVREVVAAARGQRLQLPVTLDELQQRDMIAVAMVDLAARGIGRKDQQRQTRSVAEEIQRLHETGVPVAAGFVPGDEHGGLGLQLRIVIQRAEQVEHVGFEQVDLRALRMTVEQTIGLAERHRREGVVLDRRDQIGGVLHVRSPDRRIGHDRRRILERIADLAIRHTERMGRIGKRRCGQVRAGRIGRNRRIGECYGVIERTAVESPGNVLLDEGVTDRPHARRREVAAAGQRAVRQIARVGVVEHVVMTRLAVRFRGIRQMLEITDDRLDAGLEHVGAGAEVGVDSVLVDGVRLRVRIGDHVRRRRHGIAGTVAPERRIAGAEHEVVGTGATVERLMEVVAQGEAVGQRLQDRSLFLFRVIEAHRVALALVRRRISRHHEREEIVLAAGGIVLGRVVEVAVVLLPVLIEAVRRVTGVVIIRQDRALQRKRTRERAGAGNASVQRVGRQVGSTRRQDIEIGRIHVLLDTGFGNGLERRRSIALRGRGALGVGLRHQVGRAVRELGDVRCADVVARLSRSRKLLRLREVRTGRAVLVDDALRQQVGDGLALPLRAIHAEGVVEAAILTDQNDDVLDRSFGLRFLVATAVMPVVVIVAIGVQLQEMMMGMVRTLVPVAAARLRAEARGGADDRQRRCNNQRGRGTPSSFSVECNLHSRPQKVRVNLCVFRDRT